MLGLVSHLLGFHHAPFDGPRGHARRVARHLDPLRLQREDDGELYLGPEDLVADLDARPVVRRFLGYYSLPGLEYALERHGLLGRLRGKGFRDLVVEGDLADPFRQVIRVRGRWAGDPEGTRCLLAELVARRAEIPSPVGAGPAPLKVLWIEWLLLQDPTSPFSARRPRLPGQDHPGLGLAAPVLAALVEVARRLGLDGIVQRPAHYHNAVVAAPVFRFLDPADAGRFEAIGTRVAGLSLCEASRRVEDGSLDFPDGTAVTWTPAALVFPTSRRLSSHLDGPRWRREAERARRARLATPVGTWDAAPSA